MARLPEKVREKKMLEARELFIRNFSLTSICDIIGISVDSLRSWRDDGNWVEEKKLQQISIGALRGEVLQTFDALKNVKKPKIGADDIAKLASAFEKLSDDKKHLAYMYECFNELTEVLATRIALAKNKRDKEQAHLVYQKCRSAMQELTDKTFKKAME